MDELWAHPITFLEQVVTFFRRSTGMLLDFSLSPLSFGVLMSKAAAALFTYMLCYFADTVVHASSGEPDNKAQTIGNKLTRMGTMSLLILFTKQAFFILYILIGIVHLVWRLIDRGLGLSLHNFIRKFNLHRNWKDNVMIIFTNVMKYFLWPLMAYLIVSSFTLLFAWLFVDSEGFKTFHILREYIYFSHPVQFMLNNVNFVNNATFMIGSALYVKKHVESLLKHSYREYEEDNIMGWNIFQHHEDGSVTFTIPTEHMDTLSNIIDDIWLHDMVIDAAKTPTFGYPSFMIILPSDEYTGNFIRHMTNHVSQRLAVSQWPLHALASRLDQSDPCEPALMITACEKDDGVKYKCTRTWLVFRSELMWLLNFTEEDIDNPQKFKVAKEDWRIRIKNLRKWAEVEADPLLTRHLSQEVIIPANASSTMLELLEGHLTSNSTLMRGMISGIQKNLARAVYCDTHQAECYCIDEDRTVGNHNSIFLDDNNTQRESVTGDEDHADNASGTTCSAEKEEIGGDKQFNSQRRSRRLMIKDELVGDANKVCKRASKDRRKYHIEK